MKDINNYNVECDILFDVAFCEIYRKMHELEAQGEIKTGDEYFSDMAEQAKKLATEMMDGLNVRYEDFWELLETWVPKRLKETYGPYADVPFDEDLDTAFFELSHQLAVLKHDGRIFEEEDSEDVARILKQWAYEFVERRKTWTDEEIDERGFFNALATWGHDKLMERWGPKTAKGTRK